VAGDHLAVVGRQSAHNVIAAPEGMANRAPPGPVAGGARPSNIGAEGIVHGAIGTPGAEFRGILGIRDAAFGEIRPGLLARGRAGRNFGQAGRDPDRRPPTVEGTFRHQSMSRGLPDGPGHPAAKRIPDCRGGRLFRLGGPQAGGNP